MLKKYWSTVLLLQSLDNKIKLFNRLPFFIVNLKQVAVLARLRKNWYVVGYLKHFGFRTLLYSFYPKEFLFLSIIYVPIITMLDAKYKKFERLLLVHLTMTVINPICIFMKNNCFAKWWKIERSWQSFIFLQIVLISSLLSCS